MTQSLDLGGPGTRHVNLAAAALSYAADAWPVLPCAWPTGDHECSCEDPECPSPGKHPLTAHGKDDATTDLDRVARWWARWPWANIGVRPPEGIAILDVDPRNGGGAALSSLEAANERLPVTLTARTGSGGWHLWFTCALPARSRLCTGVDVKTHTGYVLAPPSRHVSGQRYTWHTWAPLAPLPRWALHELDRAAASRGPLLPRARPAHLRSSTGTGDELLRALAGAHEGTRNHLLYWAARCVHEDYSGDPDLLAELERTALDRGLTAREVRLTLRSAAR